MSLPFPPEPTSDNQIRAPRGIPLPWADWTGSAGARSRRVRRIETMDHKKLIIVSGLSGSGKSVALHTLEDLGYYCIDNLPLFLLRELALGLEQTEARPFEHTAVGIDALQRKRKGGIA